MIAFILSAVMLITPHGIPDRGTATWYGSTHSEEKCYGGYGNTCTPYSSGELDWYAAVGTWKYHDKPYKVKVCLRDKPNKCVVVIVRDYCHAAWQRINGKGRENNTRVIDLSPKAFLTLAPLSRGVLHVIIREVGWNIQVGKVSKPTGYIRRNRE